MVNVILKHFWHTACCKPAVSHQTPLTKKVSNCKAILSPKTQDLIKKHKANQTKFLLMDSVDYLKKKRKKKRVTCFHKSPNFFVFVPTNALVTLTNVYL